MLSCSCKGFELLPGQKGDKRRCPSYLSLLLGTSLEDLGNLFAGVGATLARDVPFSAAYWGLLEPIRRSLLPTDRSQTTPALTVSANMLAGALGGGAASAMTQPLVSHIQSFA